MFNSWRQEAGSHHNILPRHHRWKLPPSPLFFFLLITTRPPSHHLMSLYSSSSWLWAPMMKNGPMRSSPEVDCPSPTRNFLSDDRCFLTDCLCSCFSFPIIQTSNHKGHPKIDVLAPCDLYPPPELGGYPSSLLSFPFAPIRRKNEALAPIL